MPSETESRDLLEPPVEVRAPRTITERLEDELRRIQRVPHVVSTAVSRRDGLPILHTLRTSREATHLCAMAATIVGASRSAGVELEKGSLIHGLVRYDKGVLAVAEAGPEAIIACILTPDANLGHVLMALERASEAVMEVLAQL